LGTTGDLTSSSAVYDDISYLPQKDHNFAPLAYSIGISSVYASDTKGEQSKSGELGESHCVESNLYEKDSD
jgi:hypothetical protein